MPAEAENAGYTKEEAGTGGCPSTESRASSFERREPRLRERRRKCHRSE
jgi:hypothetical protein